MLFFPSRKGPGIPFLARILYFIQSVSVDCMSRYFLVEGEVKILTSRKFNPGVASASDREERSDQKAAGCNERAWGFREGLPVGIQKTLMSVRNSNLSNFMYSQSVHLSGIFLDGGNNGGLSRVRGKSYGRLIG